MKKNSKKMNFSKQEKVLAITFILLLFLVIVLSVFVVHMKNDVSNKKASIVIPILEEGTGSELSLDVEQLDKNKDNEYVFKISNYKNEYVNKRKLKYTIKIEKTDNISVQLFKNNEDNNLLANQVLIENELPYNNKKEDVYRLIINVKSEVFDNEKITIKINS